MLVMSRFCCFPLCVDPLTIPELSLGKLPESIKDDIIISKQKVIAQTVGPMMLLCFVRDPFSLQGYNICSQR